MGLTWFIEPSFNYFSCGPEWQLLDMRDKLVGSPEQPEQPGHCWPCADSGVTSAISCWGGIISPCFVNLAAAVSPIILLSRSSWDTALLFISGASFRVASSAHMMSLPLVTELMKMLPGWCQQIVMRLTLSGHPIMCCDQVSRCHETSGDICDTLPVMTRSRAPCLCGNKFQFLCNLGSLAIFVSGVKSSFSLFPSWMGGLARAGTTIIMDLNTFRQQLCIPGRGNNNGQNT